MLFSLLGLAVYVCVSRKNEGKEGRRKKKGGAEKGRGKDREGGRD